MSRLVDAWYEATFVRTDPDGRGHCEIDSLDGADGLQMWCPCGYGKSEYPLDGARPHAIIVSFANPRGTLPAPENGGSRSRSGAPSRWMMSGTGLADLTLAPSIDVTCWHGFITAGEVK